MDRLKQSILSNTKTVQEQIQEINIRLNNIIQEYKKISNEIASLTYNDFISNKDYCLNISKQQHKIIQNLLVINLQLEEYQLTSKQKVDKSQVNKSNSLKEQQITLINKWISSNVQVKDICKIPKKEDKKERKEEEDLYFKGYLQRPLTPNKDMICLISHIVSPSEFYINCSSEAMEEIERNSIDYSKDHDSPEYYFLSKSEAKVNLKLYCLCYIDHWQFWLRAKVIDWLDSDGSNENVKVFLVDYGYTFDVPFKNLRPLYKKYAYLRECAIKCHMAYLYPVGSTEEKQIADWPQDAIKTFKDLIGPENQCYFKIVYANRFRNSWGIDLIRTTLNYPENPTVGQQFRDKKQCVEIAVY